MSRWDEILLEPAPAELTRKTMARVAPELKALKPAPFWQRRTWLTQFGLAAMGAAGLVLGYRMMDRAPEAPGPVTDTLPADLLLLVDAVGEDAIDLEMLEDLHVLEALEEMESWNG